jgi:hypothetical protein
MADATASFVLTARDQTGVAFASVDKNLKQLQRTVNGVRQIFGFFGVGLGARAFAGWIAQSLQATEAVGEQREAVLAAQRALGEFKKASDTLAESIAVRATPSINALAAALNSLRQTWAPTEAEALEKQIRLVEDEINRMASGIIKFEQGNFWQRLAGEKVWQNAREEVERLRVELQRLYALRRSSAPTSQPITAQEEQALNDLIAELNTPKPRQPIITQDELVALESFIYDLNQRPPLITLEERIALEEFINDLNEVPERLTQEEWIDLESFIYDLNHMEKEANKVAVSIGEDFKLAFDGWILGAERSFGELLRRMAVQMSTSAIFKGLATFFGGGTGKAASFFSDFFGGARAEGGPVSAGKAYLVGERGPELFMPSQSGMIAANAGPSFHFETSIDARGADQSVLQRLPKILADNNQRLKAEIKHELGRGR